MDHSRPLRRAVLQILKASGPVTSIIPAPSLFPLEVPASRTFPFGRFGAPTTMPFRASGLNSSSHRFTYYGYLKPLYATPGDSQTALMDSASSQAEKFAAAVKDALDGRILVLEIGMKATLTWLGSNWLQDPTEKEGWQANVSFGADVAG